MTEPKFTHEDCLLAERVLIATGRAGANDDTSHPLRQLWEVARNILAEGPPLYQDAEEITPQRRAYAALKNAVPYLEHLSDVLPADDKGNPSDLLGEIQALLNLQRGEP